MRLVGWIITTVVLGAACGDASAESKIPGIAGVANGSPPEIALKDDVKSELAGEGHSDETAMPKKGEEEPVVVDPPNATDSWFSESLVQVAVAHSGGTVQAFQAQVMQLMDIIVNYLYQDREIFLRELVSNASDALEGWRLLGVQNSLLKERFPPEMVSPRIDIRVDIPGNLVAISDTGIGMTKSELTNNLGTIAKSGTSEFIKQALDKKGQDERQGFIGKFGVGFYSAFLVAKDVTVISRHVRDAYENEKAPWHMWRSTGDGNFTVVEAPQEIAEIAGKSSPFGTTILLQLKEDAKQEYLSEWNLRNHLKKFTEFISVPVRLYVRKKEEDKVPTQDSGIVVNPVRPLWLRPKEDILYSEYESFYKALSPYNYSGPLTWSHFTAEGTKVTFTALIYIPQRNEHSFYMLPEFSQDGKIRLYSKRVLVSEDLPDFMPRWLSFVTGVIDSDQLDLKVDRQSVTKSAVVKAIQKKVIAKALDLIVQVAQQAEAEQEIFDGKNDDNENEENAAGADNPFKSEDENKIKSKSNEATDLYNKILGSYGHNLTSGCIEDSMDSTGIRKRIGRILRFESTAADGDGKTSLPQYVKRMIPGQKKIYYASGETKFDVISSARLEPLRASGAEVLLITQPLEEQCLAHIKKFEGYEIVSVDSATLKLEDYILTEDETEKKAKVHEARMRLKAIQRQYEPFTTQIQSVLNDRVTKVRVGYGMQYAAARIVVPTSGYSAASERMILHSGAIPADFAKGYMSQKILEVNPAHPLVEYIYTISSDTTKTDEFTSLTTTLFNTGLLASGYIPESTNSLAIAIYNGLMKDRKLEMPIHPKSSTDIDVDPQILKAVQDEAEAKKEASKKTNKPSTEEDQDDEDEQDPADNPDIDLSQFFKDTSVDDNKDTTASSGSADDKDEL